MCLPKHKQPEKVNDYRPLTLLNTDYKLYTRILARRLQTTMGDIMNEEQYSAVKDRNIIDAAAGIRDVIAAGQHTAQGICMTVNRWIQTRHKNTHICQINPPTAIHHMQNKAH